MRRPQERRIVYMEVSISDSRCSTNWYIKEKKNGYEEPRGRTGIKTQT